MGAGHFSITENIYRIMTPSHLTPGSIFSIVKMIDTDLGQNTICAFRGQSV